MGKKKLNKNSPSSGEKQRAKRKDSTPEIRSSEGDDDPPRLRKDHWLRPGGAPKTMSVSWPCVVFKGGFKDAAGGQWGLLLPAQSSGSGPLAPGPINKTAAGPARIPQRDTAALSSHAGTRAYRRFSESVTPDGLCSPAFQSKESDCGSRSQSTPYPPLLKKGQRRPASIGTARR